MKKNLQILIIGFVLATSCEKGTHVFYIHRSGGTIPKKLPVTASGGICSSDIESSRSYDAEIGATSDCPPDDAALIVPKGSFTTPTRVSIGKAESLATDQLGKALIPDLTFTSSGAAVTISSETGEPSAVDMELRLPLPAGYSKTSQIQPVLIYKVKKSAGATEEIVGITTPSDVRVEGEVAIVKVRYFGDYQIVMPSAVVLSRVEKPAGDVSSAVATTAPGKRVYWMNGVQTLSTMTSTPSTSLSSGTGWVMLTTNAVIGNASGTPIVTGIRAKNFDEIP